MAERLNYLLGFGERLTQPIEAPGKRGSKNHPYTFAEARQRLAPRIERAVAEIAELPLATCPHNESVAAIILHPKYLAKSSTPVMIHDAYCGFWRRTLDSLAKGCVTSKRTPKNTRESLGPRPVVFKYPPYNNWQIVTCQ